MPQICGVHNVALVRDTLPIDHNNPHPGRITASSTTRRSLR
jgi:hypothetical protein